MKRNLLLSVLLTVVALAYGQTGQYYPSERFSSGLINDVCQDKFGYIWIATENGLNKFDGYRFTTYLHQSGNEATLNSNIVVKLYNDSQGRLWVGTRLGLSRFDYGSGRFVEYPFSNNEMPRVISMMERRNGDFLVGTSGRGLHLLTGDSLQKIPDGYSSSGGKWYFNQMMEDSKGRFWKCGYGEEVTFMEHGEVHQLFVEKGMVVKLVEVGDEILIVCLHGIYSYRNGELSLANIDMSAFGGKDVVMCSAYLDRDDNLYIGTRGDGLFKLSKGSRTLNRVECSLQGIDLNTAKIMAIQEDRLGNIWLGCQSKGLVMLPRLQPQFSAWSFSAQRYSVSSTITSVCEGSQGMTWCTLQGNGVYGFDNHGRIVAHPSAPTAAEFIYRDKHKNYWIGTDEALYAYDPLTGRSERHISLVCEKLNDMIDNGDGNLYISTYSRGFCIYNTVTHEVRKYLSTDENPVKGKLWNNWILDMMFDHNGRLWLATSSGVCAYDPKDDSFHPYGWEKQLDGRMCYSLCETRKGEILIGTDQGLYRYAAGAGEAVPFDDDGALADKVVGYIVEAADGDIWCSTSMGIWQYDVRKKKFIGHVSGNGLTAKEYINCVGMHTADDMVYLANNDGLTVFLPSKVTGSHKELPDVKMTGFYIAGNSTNRLSEENHYRVSYLDTGISLEFSLLDFNNPSSIIYEYRINNGKWIQAPEGQNSIQLSHLQPGTYNIEVRALSADVYSKPTIITVTVTPPWYLSTWAYLIYMLALLGVIIWTGWAWRRRTKRQLAEEKMKFLINATHDIRSPLTLIMSPLASLKRRLSGEEKDNSIDAIRDIDTIEHNANRILNLVNQILDVRKIDKQQLHLHCQQTEMVGFVKGICKMFEYSAQERNITFRFNHEDEKLDAWVDRSQFDKVVTNLLSNAFKYSFDGGSVDVNLSHDDTQMKLQVIDNGVGLDADSLKHIFDRFYQGTNSYRMHIDGTGIGLNLCKMIVDMHHGTITASNRDGQKGSVFEVCLPLGYDHLTEEEIEKEPVDDSPQQSIANSQKSSIYKHRVLVVDDDNEICNYISTELGRYYKLTTKPNGKEGLKELLTGEYDLVVSDVMMPEMDGFTMLRMIKTNVNIAHLPVVMLTSKADVANRLEGLERGADAFLAKPFDLEELHMVIENLIQSRQRLKGKYSGAQQQVDKLEQPEVKGNDELLMERIMKSVNKNLSNSDFNVDMLTQEVGISRAQLHRKMKEMTGISTSEFIRNIRLEQAARLLREQKVNVTQVAYTVGFSNLAHFSTIFRKHFGISPSEYAEHGEKL